MNQGTVSTNHSSVTASASSARIKSLERAAALDDGHSKLSVDIAGPDSLEDTQSSGVVVSGADGAPARRRSLVRFSEIVHRRQLVLSPAGEGEGEGEQPVDYPSSPTSEDAHCPLKGANERGNHELWDATGDASANAAPEGNWPRLRVRPDSSPTQGD